MRVNASACPVLRRRNPGVYVRSSIGNRETSTLAAREVSGPPREGDSRSRSCTRARGQTRLSGREASERGRATGRGVRGAKGGGQGERGTGRHAPDTEPARRVPRPGPRAASRMFRRQHPRWEPDALIGPSGSVRGALRKERPTAIVHIFRFFGDRLFWSAMRVGRRRSHSCRIRSSWSRHRADFREICKCPCNSAIRPGKRGARAAPRRRRADRTLRGNDDKDVCVTVSVK